MRQPKGLKRAGRWGRMREEIIGTGYRERAVIDPVRFLARLEKKAAG